jgi:hypothetical protein
MNEETVPTSLNENNQEDPSLRNELDSVNEEILATNELLSKLTERKLELEAELNVDNERVEYNEIISEHDRGWLEQNNLYCDKNELLKFEDKALTKHMQSFDQMAQRGGMGIHEIYALASGMSAYEAARKDTLDLVKHLYQIGIFKRR